MIKKQSPNYANIEEKTTLSDHTGPPGRGVAVAKTDLKFSLSKFDDINYTIEEMIASAAYPDLVGTYWKGSLTPNAATSETLKTSKIINYRGMSIYRIQKVIYVIISSRLASQSKES